MSAGITEGLATYDILDKSNDYGKRSGFQILYDIFQRIILPTHEICKMSEKDFCAYSVDKRWRLLDFNLRMIDEEGTAKWSKFIVELSGERNHIQHNDFAVPSERALNKFRSNVTNFEGWLSVSIKKYKAHALSFDATAVYLADKYIEQIKHIREIITEDTKEFVGSTSRHDYFEELESILPELDKISTKKPETKLGVFDLHYLVRGATIIGEWDARERVLVGESKCPNCGNKIKEIKKNSSSCGSDGAPVAVYVRIGCETCEYTLHDDVFEI